MVAVRFSITSLRSQAEVKTRSLLVINSHLQFSTECLQHVDAIAHTRIQAPALVRVAPCLKEELTELVLRVVDERSPSIELYCLLVITHELSSRAY
ncbi:hypothetical protein [Coleofasciculus sp. FACHB-SPT36]|uniref:hypothetical protein n=1 Tax=Cyanophyceae TaxID=3028117 RepID=UPI00168B2A4B|nr:hypothetical protein [Coleofasciculus sp. FACHB-SPT36]MBD2540865.1 hypothetical protein [Coleofasciculus sp. FACHB-SPT36]